MAHEIGTSDGLVLHKNAAWHGLGVVVEDAPTPREALILAGLEWGVDQQKLFTESNGLRVPIDTHVANMRMDTGELLGVVSSHYKPVQNADVADFCEALLEDSIVRCESVGSIRNGKKVWFLLKGEGFDVANGDGIFPYIMVANGHDGLTSYQIIPTTVRVVCSNTLHMVIPRGSQLGTAAISIKHTTNVMTRIEEARKALRSYGKAMEATKDAITTLVAKDVNNEMVQQFFLESYTADFGEIPINPKDRKQSNACDRALSAWQSFTRRFDDERKIAGSNMWNALNAYTRLIQHDKKSRGSDDENRVIKRIDSNLFGLNQQRSQSALIRALTMATAG